MAPSYTPQAPPEPPIELNVDFFDSEMHQTQHLVVRAMAAQSFSRFATPLPLTPVSSGFHQTK
jgi:hypothetical protein